MAKKSIVDKNEKLLRKIQTHLSKRSELSKLLKDDNLSLEEKMKIMKVLDATRGSSYIRYRKRCKITGRPRGYRGGVGLCRGALRYYASFGFIAGVKKV